MPVPVTHGTSIASQTTIVFFRNLLAKPVCFMIYLCCFYQGLAKTTLFGFSPISLILNFSFPCRSKQSTSPQTV